MDPDQAELKATFLDPHAPVVITQANLPHWHQADATYFLTFRLVDSLPKEKLEQLTQERDDWLATHPEPISEVDWAEYHRRFSATIEHWLDQGSGSCVLDLPQCRQIVEDALRYFDGQRYQLGELVVAANHVHVIVRTRNGHDLSEILHSWKGFTSKEISKVEAASRRFYPFWTQLNARRQTSVKSRPYQRPVWQKESYDHIVRSPEALCKIEEYIRDHDRSRWS